MGSVSPAMVDDLSRLRLDDQKECELFGGAMTICLPASFVDVSTMREIPDTQECWTDAGTSDQSFIVEILGLEDTVADADSPKYYWDDLVQMNEAALAQDSTVESVRAITGDFDEIFKSVPLTDANVAGPSCWMLQGVQRVAKFKEHDRNTVKVYMAVMRLPSVDSDIVMHYNYPLFLAPASSSAAVSEVSPRGSTGGSGLGSLARDDNRQAGNGSTAVDLVSVRGEADRLEQESFRPGDTCDTAAGEERFRRILASLKIKDWGLFDAPMPAGS